jgi:5'-nucleotidase
MSFVSGNPFTVLSDSDDTIFAMSPRLYERFADMFPHDTITPLEKRLVFNLFLPEDAAVHHKILAVMDSPGFFRNLPVIDGADEALRKMLERGLNPSIVTTPWVTNPTCYEDKMWSFENQIGAGWGRRAHFCWDKTKVRGQLLFDDKGDIKGGLVPEWRQILVTKPHNFGVEGIERVADLREWEPVVDAELERFARKVAA